MSDSSKLPQDLLEAAQRAHQNAYAPYSGFHVGAALRAASGTVYAGANIENASYGLGRCAEQSAVQAMASAGERTFNEIVVYTTAPEPASPCGACRQVMFEFAESATVFLVNDQGVVKPWTVGGLLPGGFKL
ncbi:MAG: Cytidine deaminase [uncultured Truepera sp.]|uniref:Cytidine deaminase n=1 Tax=uncultured Truepera sp. TaxID=543023 RepID=A0A6J4VXM2_9DEIN|nr:MAG: Cytidine deaminase [uncultured Truepera sp.]